MLTLPLFTELQPAQRILLAGAGGGFDISSGLPLYFALRSAGKEVFLANLSFTTLHAVGGERVTDAMVKVTADSDGPRFVNYFPEGYLCQWFREQGEEVPIWCFDRVGVRPLVRAYRHLVQQLQLDTIVLVDGGTDSLMRGDEAGLGTPEEDISSIAAVDCLDVPRKLLVCLGFGVDHYHGVCHAQFLEAVAEITRAGGFLGAFSLLAEMPEVRRYAEAVHAVVARMPRSPSIVSTSILSAIEGRYGDYHATDRTAGSQLWINPLMALYWGFKLDSVARRILYLEELKKTELYVEVDAVIGAFRYGHKAIREWESIPLSDPPTKR
jgi:hypothetical protein